MELTQLNFAFAVNKEDQFENKHFGEAQIFRIYQFLDGKMVQIKDVENPFLDEINTHNSPEKAEKIINLLKQSEVSVLVSLKFGANLKLVNQHFVPVLVAPQKPEEVIQILKKNMLWISDEFKNRKANHMLIKISSGIVKTAIN